MSNLSAHPLGQSIGQPVGAITRPVVTAQARTIALLFTVALLAMAVYYFVGIDEGALSVFGKSTVLHEFFHDGRHFAGFPCH